MAETNIRWNDTPIDVLRRDSLSLKEINKNGNVGEMIDTINANFRNIAEHGGGPAGYDGNDGVDGVDGVNAEFIYALCDSITDADEGTKYPADNQGMADLFARVDQNGEKASFGNVEWYNHPQGISAEHKNEYMMARYRKSEDSPWTYSKPTLWSHWGETGKDGDGVEYIFMTSSYELSNSELSNALPKKSTMDEAQKIIFNMDDFYPGSGWFTEENRNKAYMAITNSGVPGIDQSNFASRWTQKFSLVTNYNWTDDPTGPNSGKPYEYVAIRRCSTNEVTGEKEWTDYSFPALWSNYNFTSRTFIIYKNTAEKDPAPARPKGGFWDTATDTLVKTKPGCPLSDGWNDKDIEDSSLPYTWISSGIFNHDGSLSTTGWSEPICITGPNGQKGEDGSYIEFIYALADELEPGVHYPDSTNPDVLGEFFNTVEEQKQYTYQNNMVWYDRAQPITPAQRTEYVWIRQKNTTNGEWIYLEKPVVWAHWGEDGTDGDGVEYIYHASTTNSCTTPMRQSEMTGQTGRYMKVIFQISDFYPGIGWFGREGSRDKAVQAIRDAGLNESYLNEHWDEIKNNFNQEWTDNPMGVTPSTPYEFVSMRTSNTDNPEAKKVWGDFSDPVLWSYYGKRTRVFMVYCNVDESDGTPVTPSGGFWNITTDKLQKSSSDTSDFIYPALNGVTPVIGSNVGYWADDDIDVRGKVCWVSYGTFPEDNTNISWSIPHRLTGAEGKKGEDGMNIEFIYALDNNPAYPTTDEGKAELFDAIERATMDSDGTKSHTYVDPSDPDKATIWYDNARPISKVNNTEYFWSRRRDNNTSPWVYTMAPGLWARWGEDGTDGDGVEYIFHMSQVNTLASNSPERPVVPSDDYQRLIYQLDDFYPGNGWFDNATNKSDVIALLQEHGLYNGGSFESMWANHFGFNIGDNSWTDNPTDVTSTQPYEFVSIRKSYTVNGEKKWGEFSEPAVWASYGKSTRTFIVYCNILGEDEPTAPPRGSGWYNSTGNGSLQMASNNDAPFKYDILDSATRSAIRSQGIDDTNIGYWSDTDNDVEGTITWMVTGTFDESGDNISWSEPHRITGDKGDKGADGSNIEFIYARKDIMRIDENYPQPGSNNSNWKKLFDLVEDPTLIDNPDYANSGFTVETDEDGVICVKYNNTRWYDRALLISEEERIVWAWSRRLPAGASIWKYDTSPFVWAHWGEDGTDGDGIEYIFLLSRAFLDIDETVWNNKFANKPTSDTAKAIYGSDDFIPNSGWFTTAHKTKVQNEMAINNKTFVENDWNTMKNYFSFDTLELGDWKDNPEKLDTSNLYQYVSTRKCSDGVWGDFSYPVLWSKYNVSKYTTFAFTATTEDDDLSDLIPVGGDYDTPIPNPNVRSGKPTIEWEDSPNPSGIKVVIWMTTARIEEGYVPSGSETYPAWSTPQRLADSNEFNVEWSSADLTLEQVNSLNALLQNSAYNFGTILYGDGNHNEATAETLWRQRVQTATMNATYGDYASSGVVFGDDSSNSVLMATCQMKNGNWTNWVVKKVKGEQGEKGDPGTSIRIHGRIAYELYLSENTPYDYQAASLAFGAAESTLSPEPQEGNLLIVYPHNMTGDIYIGDSTIGGALYMWKYNGTQWIDYNNPTTNGEEEGSSYSSPNKHLILWDGDSWQDIGELEGPEGKPWILVVKYANDNQDGTGKVFVTNDTEIPGAKWMGTLVYLDDGSNHDFALNDPTYVSTDHSKIRGWQWSLFKGQDGYGYEYIFKGTSGNEAPQVPDYTEINQDVTPNVIPNGYSITNPGYYQEGWTDEPIEPDTENNRFIWMCWRRFNHATGKWSRFMGKNNGVYPTGIAKLWQIFSNSIEDVEEFFHADESFTPADINTTPVTDTTYWFADKSECGWGLENPYLFNVEVLTYTDGTKAVLDPHFIASWDQNISDFEDYYIIESADSNNGDPGEIAPRMNGSEPIIAASTGYTIEGKGYWTQDVSKTRTNKEWPVLWNITKKIYNGGKSPEWTSPLVIGVYGEGDNGADSIYADLDNEMDVVQIDTERKVLYTRTCETTVTMYSGAEVTKIRDIDVSGDSNIIGHCTRTYYSGETEVTGVTPANMYTKNIDSVKLTFVIMADTVLSSLSSKVVVSVTSLENITRKTSYTIAGTTQTSTFTILPSETAIVYDGSSLSTDEISITVVEFIGEISKTYTNGTDVDGRFKLFVQVNTDEKEDITETFSILTDGLNPGDKLTFTVAINSDSDETYETILDKETIYVLLQGSDGQSVFRKYAQYVDTWGLYQDIVGINPAGTVITFKSNDNVTHTASTTNYPKGADDDHCIEVMSERLGNGGWSEPVIVARQFSDDEIEAKINASLTTENQSLVDFISDTTRDAMSDTLVGYATTEYVDLALEDVDMDGYVKEEDLESELSHYVNSTTFESFKSDANRKTASSELITANSTFAVDDDGYLIWKSNGVGSNFTSAEDYYNSLSSTDKNKLDTDHTNMGLNDPTVVKNLINKMKTNFKMTYTEIASITTSVSDKMSQTEIINAINNGSSTIKAAITAYVNSDSSGISLNADRINIDASHKLSLRTGTFTINSENFKIDEYGNVTARGSIEAESFSAISNSGSLTRTTSIDGRKFEISTSGSINSQNVSNSIYITILDQVTQGEDGNIVDDNGDLVPILYGVPTLCMMYNNVPYILDPSNWKSMFTTKQSNMRFILQNNILECTVTPPTSTTNGYNNDYFGGHTTVNGKSFDYYIIKPNDNGNYVTQQTINKLYRIEVLSWSNNASTEASNMKSYGLKYNQSTSDMTTCAYTTYSLLDKPKYSTPTIDTGLALTDRSQTSKIDVNNCQRFKFFLPSSTLSFGIVDEGCIYYQVFDGDDSISSDYGADKLFTLAKNLLKDFYTSAGSQMGQSGWHVKINNGIIHENYTLSGIDDYIPFDTSGDYNDYGGIKISIYPMCTIPSPYYLCNGGSNATNTVLVNCHISMEKHIGSSGSMDCEVNGLTYNGSQVRFSMESLMIDMNFDLIIKFGSAVDYNPHDATTYSTIVSVVKSFLEGTSFPYGSSSYNTSTTTLTGKYKTYFSQWMKVNGFIIGNGNGYVVNCWGKNNSTSSYNDIIWL